jgi:hypothetical protein
MIGRQFGQHANLYPAALLDRRTAASKCERRIQAVGLDDRVTRQLGGAADLAKRGSLEHRLAGFDNARAVQPTLVADIALAEIDAAIAHNPSHHAIGNVDRLTPIADMTSGDAVSFSGAGTKGIKQAKVGSLNVWREMQFQAQSHCMGDMFTIEEHQAWYVRPTVSRPRDSGAWVLSRDDNVVGWDGMLIGGDSVQAYCVFAESIMDACTNSGKFGSLVIDS